MQEILGILEKCALFNGISRQDALSMLGCLGARTVDMKKGIPVLSEGEPVGWVGIVLTGAVQLVRTDYYGNRSVVSRVEAAQLFGEAYAFSGAPSLPVSVVPEKDGKALMIDSRRITGCCSNACEFHKTLIYNLLHLVAMKNLVLHQKIEITSHRSTREKLLAYLLTQAKLQGSDHFTIPFDRQGLADYLEVERSGLSAEISKLRREGVLESDKSCFRLLKKYTQED